jgi:hypothetical protein
VNFLHEVERRPALTGARFASASGHRDDDFVLVVEEISAPGRSHRLAHHRAQNRCAG